MIRYLLLFISVLLLTAGANAQELTSRRTQADRLFERAEYYNSLEIYLKLAESENAPVEVWERIADCYRLMNNYERAEEWYAKLINIKGIRIVDVFFYAEALLRNKKFALAKDMYKRYYANETDKGLVNFRLAVCDSAEAWMKRDGNYAITVEKRLNTIFSDWGPSYLNKDTLLFTSDLATGEYRNNDKGIYARTGNEWLKMFTYDIKKQRINDVDFQRSGRINLKKDYHTGPMVVNQTGDTAYVTVTTRAGRGSLSNVKTPYDERVYIRRLELVMVIKEKGKWSKFVPFQYNDVSKYSVGHVALTPDGKMLYFTSDMPGGLGKTDIWYCQRLSDGKWSKPINCGKTINTVADEAFPSIGGDSKLYFASKGLPGMGGYDIFSSTGSGTNWSEPKNLKHPLNSTSDDFALATLDGKTGFFSSDRQGGSGNDDIYAFTYTGTDDQLKTSQPIAAKPAPPTTNAALGSPAMVILEGTVMNNASGKQIDSVSVTLRNSEGIPLEGKMVGPDGKFQFKVVPGRDYTVETRRKGFYPVSNHLPGRSIVPGFSAIIQLAMEPLTTDKTFIIRNIYYDLNMYDIRPDAQTEMDNLVRIMKENPTIKIELSAHTDARGSDYYNMLLSDARAKAAVAYLRRHGIAGSRMVAKGYGETRLLNECANRVRCSEEDHQFNRRTEIKIIEGVK
ncbi:OmpA family protein [Mucilaginibacter myungsuensis]|uniref:OmpA family protein n=1 Tax=Mucilaginibacter myungsuensis TaxID=649104 RepID=A0A929KU59_9SPHI|nr:OmpA family protein [Mucilaginibacter myungsuensis]MBE9661614.1 OmpA family protein [Mucilaginibacter myungsuensis]MDN3597758.1 OmpA family protein [Mucilaginibacter myungsuensis]